jgi:ubiquitin carboxyl-terminal hydrolase 34
MDARTLQNHAVSSTHDQDPDVVSRPYLHALLFLFNKNESSHIGRNLEAHYQWDWDEDIIAMSEGFQNQGGDIRTLTNLVKGYLDRMGPNPKLIESCTEPCRLVSRAVSDIAHTHHNSDMPHSQTTDETQRKALDGFDFFKVMSAGLEVIIDKHVTFLSPDSAHVHLSHLYDIFKCVLGYDAPAIRKVFESHTGDRSRLSQRQWPKVISLEWKFTILKKLITSTQMQLRVVGVTTMCSDLVNLYSTHNKGVEASNNPILLYFADFILANQLVDYIVSIGSHPEIINESNNILGFLVVTKTYKSAQTDKIWQTVMTSQDPRVVEAILKMLTKCLHLYDYRSLLYLCKKLADVPIESFTPVMREFCTSLFTKLVEKVGQEGNSYLGPAPYYLCLRLVKESSITLPDGSLRSADVHGFANRTLGNLLPHGPGTEVRKEIYHNCIQDISARSPTAAGSICIINILLKHNTTSDLHALTVKQGLTQLLVEDLEASVLENSADQDTKNSPANQARRELLLGIIVNEPSTISPELGQRLWDVLVGTKSKSAAERDTSWQILNNAVKRASSSNVFIASCFQNYLPMLPPQCFTQGALDFAREAVHSWLEDVRTDISDQDQTFESQALEQIWHMILTAPPETIDATAISMLVEVYVDSALILNMPRFKARTIHLALVDRCLKQLKGAAAKLKVFNGDASSSSDEAMVIVASEDEFAEQETIFARSLAVLKGFLTAYQSKPQFATPKSRSPITGASSAVEGEPMTVKYQSFDGDKHTEVRSLTLGKLNTAAALFASLQKATGFKNYKVYCAGKEFDPDEIEVCRSLDDLKLNGLVLVQRREDADALPAHMNSNKPTLEVEITKHFDDLWSYLSMHDKVAQEVCTMTYIFKQ